MNVILAGTNASPSYWTDLPCQRIKLVGKRHLVAAIQHELTFANHVHQFDAGQNTSGGLEYFEIEHRFGDAFNSPVVLLDDGFQDISVRANHHCWHRTMHMICKGAA